MVLSLTVAAQPADIQLHQARSVWFLTALSIRSCGMESKKTRQSTRLRHVPKSVVITRKRHPFECRSSAVIHSVRQPRSASRSRYTTERHPHAHSDRLD